MIRLKNSFHRIFSNCIMSEEKQWHYFNQWEHPWCPYLSWFSSFIPKILFHHNVTNITSNNWDLLLYKKTTASSDSMKRNIIIMQHPYVQSHSLMLPSQPHVISFDVSWGCHLQPIHTLSWAWNLLKSFVVFQSHMNTLPSPSPDATYDISGANVIWQA